MAQFTNQAQLSFNGGAVNSNVAVGELLEVLSATKTTLDAGYSPGDTLTYVISLINSGTTPLTGITVTDDLGGYPVGGSTVYPLAYVDGTARLYVDGILQPAPTISAGPPLVASGLTVPAEGNLILIYAAQVTPYADPGTEGRILNTAVVTGGGISAPITVTAEVPAASDPELTITKTVSPVPVAENGRLTYTFLIQNSGSRAAVATDDLVLTDTFDPILTDLIVSLDGLPLAEGADYTYNALTGLFATAAGRITVPAATFTQTPDGAWIVTPGVTRLVVSGTV